MRLNTRLFLKSLIVARARGKSSLLSCVRRNFYNIGHRSSYYGLPLTRGLLTWTQQHNFHSSRMDRRPLFWRNFNPFHWIAMDLLSRRFIKRWTDSSAGVAFDHFGVI